MTEAYILSFSQDALITAFILAGPVLAVSLMVGSLVSLFQAATQINETTLTFLPKILSVVLVIALLGSWMGQKLIAFTTAVFTNLPNMPR